MGAPVPIFFGATCRGVIVITQMMNWPTFEVKIHISVIFFTLKMWWCLAIISHPWIQQPCTSLLPLRLRLLRLGHRSHILAGSPTSLPSSCWRLCRPLTQQNGTSAVRLALGYPEFSVEARWGQTWLRLLWNEMSRFRTAARVISVFWMQTISKPVPVISHNFHHPSCCLFFT